MAKITSAALKAKILALQAQLVTVEAEEKLTQINVAVGDTQKFNFGRGENRKEYTGVVRAIIKTDKGDKYKMLAGEGVDEEFIVISLGDIVVDMSPVDAEIAVERMETALAADSGGASADPLALLS